MIRLVAGMCAAALLLTGCSKSQHEQAVEWQQFYGPAAVQFQQDVRYTEAARAQYAQTPTDENLRVLVAMAGKVGQDVTSEPAGAGRRSGPGTVGDAVQSLDGIEDRVSQSAADIDATDFTIAVEQWNQAVSLIWKAGSGEPAPTV